MIIVGNIYKQGMNISKKQAAENIIRGFTRELHTWWDKMLTKNMKVRILNAVREDSKGRPILDK